MQASIETLQPKYRWQLGAAKVHNQVHPLYHGSVNIANCWTRRNAVEDVAALRWLEIAIESQTPGGEDVYVLQCRENANESVRAIDGSLNLASVMGPTRSGKSTLMNLLAGAREKELFPTAAGGDPFTSGRA
jgi:polynucleotide 5'-kinase involved in rRNA processing